MPPTGNATYTTKLEERVHTMFAEEKQIRPIIHILLDVTFQSFLFHEQILCHNSTGMAGRRGRSFSILLMSIECSHGDPRKTSAVLRRVLFYPLAYRGVSGADKSIENR